MHGNGEDDTMYTVHFLLSNNETDSVNCSLLSMRRNLMMSESVSFGDRIRHHNFVILRQIKPFYVHISNLFSCEGAVITPHFICYYSCAAGCVSDSCYTMIKCSHSLSSYDFQIIQVSGFFSHTFFIKII